MDPVSYCRDKVSSSGELPALIIAFAPKQQQSLLWGSEALRQTLFELPRIPETAVANAKLAWWRDELARLNKGNPRHPITRAIFDTTDLFKQPDSILRSLWIALQGEIDRELDVSDLSTWLSVAENSGGALATLENLWLGLSADDQVTARIGGLIRAWSWLRQTKPNWLLAPTNFMARHQLSRRTLVESGTADAVTELRRDLGRMLSGLTDEICESAKASSEVLSPAQLISIRLAQSAGPVPGTVGRMKLLGLTISGWQAAREAAGAGWS